MSDNEWQQVITNDNEWHQMTGKGATDENEWEQIKLSDFKFQNEKEVNLIPQFYSIFMQYVTTIYSAIMIIYKSGDWYICTIIFCVCIVQLFLHFFATSFH